MRAKFGRRRDAGKRRQVPDDLLGLLAFLETECHSWVRWQEDVSGKSELPDKVRRKLKSATKQIQALHAELTEAIDATRAGL